jgi:hypothetical protein
MEGIVVAAPQSAGDTVVAFDVISPSGLGTIQSNGWIDVRAHNYMVLIATPATTGATVRIESKRTTTDPVVSTLVANTAIAAGVTSELYNSDLNDVAYIRVVSSSGTSPNTIGISFYIS